VQILWWLLNLVDWTKAVNFVLSLLESAVFSKLF